VRFTFFANQAHTFIDSDYEGKGVGGSEASLILLCRHLAILGHQVEVFSHTTQEGILSGVRYVNISRFDHQQIFDVAILFRSTFLGFAAVQARRRVFWTTDLDFSDWDRWIFPFVDVVFTLSEFHNGFLKEHYPCFKDKKTVTLGLGIAANEYEQVPIKSGNELIFCSVPERGLEFLRQIFDAVHADVTNAVLHITSDYSLWGRSPGTDRFRQMFSHVPGVIYHGKVSRECLVQLQYQSKLMVYPCTYPEGFCLAALECMAAGAVPVTTNGYALSTTVNGFGVLNNGTPGKEDYDERFVAAVVRLLTFDDERCALADRARAHVLNELTWNKVADRFIWNSQ
jgi:glycosyltransferase involved in cell wall biosynthesis